MHHVCTQATLCRSQKPQKPNPFDQFTAYYTYPLCGGVQLKLALYERWTLFPIQSISKQQQTYAFSGVVTSKYHFRWLEHFHKIFVVCLKSIFYTNIYSLLTLATSFWDFDAHNERARALKVNMQVTPEMESVSARGRCRSEERKRYTMRHIEWD